MKRSLIYLAFALIVVGITVSGCSKKALDKALGGEGAWDLSKARTAAKWSEASRIGVHGEVSGVAGLSSNDIIDVLFDFDRYTIRKDAKSILVSNADYLKAHKGAKILIEGHCDERGTAEYNIALGDRRAKSVKKYLTDLGISASRITIRTYGEEKPFCTEHNERCWQKNRRAHFKITG